MAEEFKILSDEDVRLIKKLNSDLTEVAGIVTQKELGKETTSKKIQKAFKDLERLNTIQKEALLKIKLLKAKVDSNFKRHTEASDELIRQTLELAGLADKIEKGDDKEFLAAIEQFDRENQLTPELINDLVLDIQPIPILMSAEIYKTFSKKRKRLLWQNKIVFNNNFLCRVTCFRDSAQMKYNS